MGFLQYSGTGPYSEPVEPHQYYRVLGLLQGAYQHVPGGTKGIFHLRAQTSTNIVLIVCYTPEFCSVSLLVT
jgi:hypothetical protein